MATTARRATTARPDGRIVLTLEGDAIVAIARSRETGALLNLGSR